MWYVLGKILFWIIVIGLIAFVLGWLLARRRSAAMAKVQATAAAQEAARLRGLIAQRDSRIAELLDQRARDLDERTALQARADECGGSKADVARRELEASKAAELQAPIDQLEAEHASASTAASAFAATTPGPVVDEAATSPAEPESSAAEPLSSPAEPMLDLGAAASVLGGKVVLDDLEVLEGIGPKIAELLMADGITTWRALAGSDAARLQTVLDAAGPRYQVHDPASWPQQAALLADGRWADFKELTDRLQGGKIAD